MAQRMTWKVELSGGIATNYHVLGGNPFEAAARGWALDQQHQSHAERKSLYVEVATVFEDVEDDIPQSSEDVLRGRLDQLVERVQALESRSTTTVVGTGR